MSDNKKKMVTQIAIFQLSSREKIEGAINDSLIKIGSLDHNLEKIDVWTEGGKWHGKIEYSLELNKLIGVDEDDQELKKLRSFNFNPDNTLSDNGYAAAKALVVQNELDIDLSLSFSDLKKEIYKKTNLGHFTPVKELEIDVEVIDVDLNLNEG